MTADMCFTCYGIFTTSFPRKKLQWKKKPSQNSVDCSCNLWPLYVIATLFEQAALML